MRRASSLFIVGLSAALAACGPNNVVSEVPQVVWGTWTTDSAEYESREFHLSAHELTIVIDESTRYVHAIDRVEVEDRNGRPFMTFYHRNRDGIEDTFRIEYADYPTTFIRIDNVDHVHWRRAD